MLAGDVQMESKATRRSQPLLAILRALPYCLPDADACNRPGLSCPHPRFWLRKHRNLVELFSLGDVKLRRFWLVVAASALLVLPTPGLAERQELKDSRDSSTKTASQKAGTDRVSATTSAIAQNTLSFCSVDDPEGFDPALYTYTVTFDASSVALYDRLIEFHPGSTSVIPGLAEGWTISADGLSYEFTLRRGVKFHSTNGFKPSRDFNADDVIFSFERQWNKSHPYYLYYERNGGAFKFFEGMDMGDTLESIQKLDDHRVRFVLSRADASFLANLAMDFASIMSAEYAELLLKSGAADKLNSEPVGTGPFQLEKYKKRSSIRYRANPNYWNGKPSLDALVFEITPEPGARLSKLKSGKCHVTSYLSPSHLEQLKREKDIRLMSQSGLNIGYLAFNTQKRPFDDKRVRQALSMAINKGRIIDEVYGQFGIAATNPFPATVWSYNKEVRDYAYDPSVAKRLLDEAGVSGLKLALWSMPEPRPYNPDGRLMAGIIKFDLERIGVKVEVVSFDWPEYLRRSKAGEHDLVMLGWTGDNGDPDNFIRHNLTCTAATSGNGRARWCHQDFDQLVTRARETTDPQKRTALYEEAQLILKDEVPWIVIAHSVQYTALRNEVSGFQMDAFYRHRFHGTRLGSP